jgi:hypothetical protein
MNDYDRGFMDGLKWVAELLRRSATIVEAPVRGDFTRGDTTVNAIAQTGNPKLAADYRVIATMLEDAANGYSTTDSH